MGSGQSSAKPAETQDADTGTQLFGSWDKPVAEAYALKKQASKKGKAAASTAADAATAALGSAINLEAGAGVKPAGKTSHAKYKGAGPVKKVKSKSGGEAWALNQSSKDPARVTAAKQALTGKLSKSIPKKPVQAKAPPQVQANAGKKRSAEAWTLSQSSKNPAKVVAAQKGLEGKLSKPRKSSQGTSTKKAGAVRKPISSLSGGKRSSGHILNLGLRANSRVVKKSSKAAAGTASKMAGKAAEAAQKVAAASQGAVQSAATTAQGAATATKTAATQAVKSAQKALNDSGIMNSAAVAEASHLSSKASEVVKEASHTVQGAMSTAVMQAGASTEKGIKTVAAETPGAAQKTKAAAAVAKSEIKKSAAKVAKKAPKAKKALKRMVSEIDAEDAKVEPQGLGRGKRQRKQVKAFEPTM
ncbi:hypothetical protein ABBQ38_013754 [Trebouxia sp. C0009 RCD-2024]